LALEKPKILQPAERRMYSQHISYHAVRQPHAIAVETENASISYQRFDRAINRFAHRLRDLVPERSRVAVRIAKPYQHWLVILALGRLGHVTASISRVFTEAELALLKPDVLVSDQPASAQAAWRHVHLSEPWVKETLASEIDTPVEHRAHAEDPARIVMSSGTTGTPKKMLFSHGLIVQRIKGGIFGQTMRADSKVLVQLGIPTFGGFGVPLRVWYFGGTVCLFEPNGHSLLARRVTGLVVSPQQLQGLVRSLPPDFTPLPELSVTVGGSALPERLSVATRLRLTPNLIQSYGSTETTTVAYCPVAIQTAAGLTGIVLPWVELEIVGSDGMPVPHGVAGEVRIRCDDMVDGYFEDEQATARAFRDGWFYPGDHGTLSPEGYLKILGRLDDLMNLGGNKIAPEPLERVLMTCPGVEDVAVFATEDPSGMPQPWAAVVPGPGFSWTTLQEVSAKCEPKLKFRFLEIGAVPRNEMGKSERYKLKEIAARRVRSRQQARSATGG
jgi:acyl-CoA synthetase (AMP-forming)/AMP-acid ligase II